VIAFRATRPSSVFVTFIFYCDVLRRDRDDECGLTLAIIHSAAAAAIFHRAHGLSYVCVFQRLQSCRNNVSLAHYSILTHPACLPGWLCFASVTCTCKFLSFSILNDFLETYLRIYRTNLHQIFTGWCMYDHMLSDLFPIAQGMLPW